MAPAFTPDASLLNPKFDGYRLKLLEQDDCVRSFPLPAPGVTQSTVSARRIVPFTEVSARIKHNHLYPEANGDGLVYIDQNGSVILVKIDETYSPSFRPIFEIPQEVSQSKSEDGEYPVALGIAPGQWLVSDGNGRFYTFDQSDSPATPAKANSSFELVDEHGSLVPLRLLHVRETQSGLVALVTKRAVEEIPPSDPKSKPPSEYDLVSLCLDPQANTVSELWSLRGSSLPANVQFDTSTNAYIVSAASVFHSTQTPEPVEPTPTKDEIAPIPRANENLDAPAAPAVHPPHAYSWTQTHDSITIMFPLPSTTTKSAIRITLSRLHLTLSILTSSSSSVPLPNYAQCPWWADIDPGASLWTWERNPDERESNVGLLTLHLEKKEAGTRWSHVFADSAGQPEVPETLDPSELALIREALEKYTTEVAGGENAMPSLANPDADEELDAPGQVGQRVNIMRIDAGSGQVKVDQHEVSVLSTPIITPSTSDVGTSLVIRRDIDGLLFESQPSMTWTHTSTFSALSFVLASKRDTRFVVHDGDKMVLAFESGSTHGTGNVYMYRGQRKKQAQWSYQSILSVASQATGALLGVASVPLREGESAVICCLCERHMVVLQDFM